MSFLMITIIICGVLVGVSIGLLLWRYRNRLFHAKDCVRAIVLYKDKHIRGYDVIPHKGIISVGSKKFIVDNNSPMMISGRFPGYFFHESHMRAIDIFDRNKPVPNEMNPEDFATIFDSKFLRDAIAASKPLDKMTMIGFGVIALVCVIGFYFLYSQISNIQTQLKQAIDAINAITGGGVPG